MDQETTDNLVKQAAAGFNRARTQALDAGLSVVESASPWTNEDTLINFVKDHAPEKVSKEWVVWAFRLLRDAKGAVNPDWLRCSLNIPGTTTVNSDEPDW